MKILAVKPLAVPGVVSVRFARVLDGRGYFSESYRAEDFDRAPGLEALKGLRFVQANESFSRKGVVRGLHFQWDPPQGKLVRVVRGHMIDLALDLRRGSPALGKITAHDMPRKDADAEAEWLWLPPGVAHGVAFLEDTTIEYLCSAPWNPAGEGGINPLGEGLDWSLADPATAAKARQALGPGCLLSDADRRRPSLREWLAGSESDRFHFSGR